MWIKRPKTLQALTKAFSSRRELVLVAQKNQSVEEPDEDDVYDAGVCARVIDVSPPTKETIARGPVLEGSTQVLVQAQSRVSIRSFSGQAGWFEAVVEQIDEGAITESPDLIDKAAVRFDSYLAARDIVVPQMWPAIRQLHDAGRVADIIAQWLPLGERTSKLSLRRVTPSRDSNSSLHGWTHDACFIGSTGQAELACSSLDLSAQ